MQAGELIQSRMPCDNRTALGLSVADLAALPGMSDDDIECIEGGGTEPTAPCRGGLAEALVPDARLTAGHDLGSVWFENHPA